MRMHALLTLSVGIAVAGSAVVYTHTFLKTPGAQQPMRDVVVAVEDIPFGHIIEPASLAVQTWPAHAVPEGTFSSPSDIVDESRDKERRAKYALARGDVIFANKISGFGEAVSITQQIDPAMRAVTIRVNDMIGVAGLITPADRIDLTLTRTVDQKLVTTTIMQDVEVLGIDQPSEGGGRDTGRIKTLTVQVDPADAQKLALAQQAGTLSVSLRHIDAADRPALKSIGVSDLTEAQAAPLQKGRRNLPTIIVNRRGERSPIEVPSG